MHEELANLSGSLSLACWTTILLPQLIEQWRRKSSDGLSIPFLLLWLFGDLCNLGGSVLAHLRPGIVLLAVWFCFSDALLLASCLYYKHTSRETQPLLEEEHVFVAVNRSFWQEWASTLAVSVIVVVVTVLSYYISSQESEPITKSTLATVLGYFASTLYLMARLPQIYKNYTRKSVEGLSIGFFTLSILGNVTYAGQILLYRHDSEWILQYLPWLLGSLGTIFEDLVIFAQFNWYRENSRLNL